jgi:hypothetical protein
MTTAYIEQVTAGRIREFGRILQAYNFPAPDNRVWHWQTGRATPQLSHLLQLCYCLGTTPLRFLTGDPTLVPPVKFNSLDMTYAQPQTRTMPKFATDQLLQILADTLADEQEPPPSLNQLAKRLGYCGHSALAHRFPEQSRAISDRYRVYQQQENLKRSQHIQNEVRQATIQVFNTGLYPSGPRVAKLLSKPSYLQTPAGQTAWREALCELGLRKSD